MNQPGTTLRAVSDPDDHENFIKFQYIAEGCDIMLHTEVMRVLVALICGAV